MDPKDFEQLLQTGQQLADEAGLEVDPQAAQSLVEQVAPTEQQQQPQAQPSQGMTPEQIQKDRSSGFLGSLVDMTSPPDAVNAMGAGALKSVFETGDFLFGDTKPEDQTSFRRGVEAQDKALKEESPLINGFASGIGQFATAMFGVGKLGAAAKMIPWVGRAAGSVGSTGLGATALESGKAALAGAIAFDPHEERLSNFIQGTPLANPINGWLAADPDDSAAEGRMKTALESIGMDAVLIGTLTLAGKAFKYLRAGDTDAAAKVSSEFDRKQQQEIAANEQPTIGPNPSGNIPSPEEVPNTGNTGEAPALATGSPALDAGDGPKIAGDSAPKQPSQVEGSGSGVVSEEVSPSVTSTPTAAVKEVNPSPVKPAVKFNDEDTAKLLADAAADNEAILKYGGRYQAAEAGYQFGKGEGVPYHRLNSDADLDDFIARAVDTKLEQLDKLKGGSVMTDARVDKMVQQRVQLTGEDPTALMAMIQQAGKDAPQTVANMEVGFNLSLKMFQDAFALNERMRFGDFTEFGSREAMEQEFAKRMSLALSMYGSAKSIASNAGRALRRQRREFGIDASMFEGLDAKQLSELVHASGGNPRQLRQLANPSVWKKAGDFMMALRINSLVSGPMTQLINIATTGYMVGARPLQRMIGATLSGDLGAAGASMRQYMYMGTALTDGWKTAVKAFTDDGIRAGFSAVGDTSVGRAAQAFARNDSVLNPHSTELYAKGTGSGAIDGNMFRPLDSLGNLMHNVFTTAGVGLGLPTRLLGATDELAKQVTYRSYVQANAHAEAVTMLAQKSGMTAAEQKAFVKEYVETKIAAAFDSQGRGLDPKALREANIATFQQELLPNTFGRTVQTAANNWPAMKLVLPFIKTPTNVIREGWKLTPALNVLQKEYREMLFGRMGREAQQQAMGQMALGSMFMGAAAYMVSNGTITGGGPEDYKQRKELMATGWKPYSVVIENEDGTKTYVSYGRADPVAIPFGIIADIQDAINNFELKDDEEMPAAVTSAIGALGIALAKQFTTKSYLLGTSQMMDALMEPENKGMNAAGSMAQSFVPYSALTRQTNDDVYMREARTLTDKLKQVTPGLSEQIPAQYNWLGEPILTRNGLWSSDNGSLVDHEVQRLALEGGTVLTRVSPNANGVDLRTITLTDGRNAYEVYQQLSGKPTARSRPLRDIVAKLIESPAYKRAPDGEVTLKGSKQWFLAQRVSKYREAAMKVLKTDANIRKAFMTDEQKVRDHYKGIRSGQPSKDNSKGLGAVGKAFGVDLGE